MTRSAPIVSSSRPSSPVSRRSSARLAGATAERSIRSPPTAPPVTAAKRRRSGRPQASPRRESSSRDESHELRSRHGKRGGRWRLAMLIRALFGVFAAALAALPIPAKDTDVDAELVLAVDVSGSMDEDEQKLQRNGYVDAFRHGEVMSAIAAGTLGRIAVTYVEWAGAQIQTVIVPWSVIDGPD